MAGGRIDIEVGADLTGFESQVRTGMEGAGSAVDGLAGKLAGLAAAAGVGMSFASVIETGNEFQKTLNSLSGVTSATAAQMDTLKAKAMELGNDTDLSATSANDAAAAMLELSKGGFSVDQSMQAAKGTLQLAAAAQIDAAEAATIQSQALQAFGLNADYAATASDVLANAANASSAEITDIAAGLQQSGAVANQFGVSIEDTAATLGVLANAGITGSDAGTLLKSTLLSLTDTSKPAVGAMETLGLTAYDASGQFVGMASLFGQLQRASETLTPEMYQQATATLLGSDAMRLGGVAAEQGAAGFQSMRQAVEQQGAAAQLAAAQNQGLPGVFERMQNTSERLQLQLYDLIDGPLTAFGTKVLDLADGALDKFDGVVASAQGGVDGLGGSVAGATSSFPMLEAAWGNLVSSGQSLTSMASDVGNGLVDLGQGALVSGGLLDTLQAAGQGAAAGLDGTLNAIQPLVSAVAGLASVFGSLPGPVQSAVTALVALRIAQSVFATQIATARGNIGGYVTSLRNFTTSTGGVVTTTQRLGSAAANGSVQMGRFGTSIAQLGERSAGIARIQSSFVGAASAAGLAGSSFARTQGAIASTGTAMRVAAGGLTSALGGPFGIAIAAAVAGLAVYAANQRKIAQHNKELEANAKDLGVALDGSNGELTNATQKAAALALEQSKLAGSGQSVLKYLDSVGISGQKAAAGLAGSNESLQSTLALLKTNADAEAAANKQNIENSLNPVVGFKDLFNIGGFSDKSKEAQNAYNDYKKLADAAIAQADSIRAVNVAAGNVDSSGTATALGTMRKTMQEFADSSGNAASKIEILNGGLSALRGDQLSTEDAQQRVNDSIRSFAAALPEGGAAAIQASGQIDTTTEAGSRLYDAMKSVQSAFDTAGTAAYQSAISQGQSQQMAAQAAQAAGQQVRDSFVQQAQAAGLTLEQANALADTYRLFPTDLKTNISVNTSQALIDAQTLKTAIDDATRDRYVKVTTAQTTIIDTPNGPRSIAQNPGQFAEGGEARGGTPGKDSIPALLMPGEHVFTTSDVQKAGGQGAMYRLRDAIQNGTARKFADGGAVDGLDNMINFARSNAGRGYVWGDWDCSMFMSQIAATGMGQTPGRLWTTYSILGGDMAGMQPGGDAGHFRIGVSDEHMAGTLFLKDGSRVNVENGGSNGGSTFGSGAAGYDDGQFGSQFHLPDAALSPAFLANAGSFTAPVMDEKTRLALDSANVSIQQAKEARDKVQAGFDEGKKTQADLDQANIKVQQAEQKAKDLEAKSSTTTAGPAPQAAEVGSFSDDEISKMRAQIAVDEANTKRNTVYADPASTENDKKEADFALIEAKNRQKEAGETSTATGGSSNGDSAGGSFSLKDRLKKFGSDVTGILVDALFEQIPFGLGESRWLTTDLTPLTQIGTYGRDQGAPKVDSAPSSFSDEEIAGQLPVTPGTPNWAENLQRTAESNTTDDGNPLESWLSGAGKDWQDQLSRAFGAPLLRDTGGPVPHGRAALNLSGETEWMLTGSERADYARDVAMMRSSKSQPAAGGGVDLSGLDSRIGELVSAARQPQVVFQTDSVEKGIRQMRSEQNLNSLTFRKRV